MKLKFIGAAKSVTGSCHALEVNGKQILIDCGLQQGRDERDNQNLEFNPGDVDFLIVTHAHIDHTGRIPLLVKQGFHGSIIATRLTGELMSIMLRDSAHIQESEAQWKNQKGRRAGRPQVEPLYTIEDAGTAMNLVTTYEYGEIVELCQGVRLRFVDAGHLLGSSSVELWLTENGVERKIVFSGDIGNVDQPIIRDPQYITESDYVVMESTYGDRLHEPPESYTEALAEIIEDTFQKGGNVIIPSFAVGRTQELLYFIREMKDRGLVKSFPDFEVCVDSPLANEATRIFRGNLHGYLDEEAIDALKGGALFEFPGLTLTESVEDSKALNMDKKSRVILSASGMCDAGRIRHHLKHNLWRPESTVVFVGYQAEGTLGRALLDGITSVKLFGEEITVRAKIVRLPGLSSHADRDHLLAWAKAYHPAPKQIFVIHGEAQVTEIFAQHLRDAGIAAHAAEHLEVYDLAADRMLEAGSPLPAKTTAPVTSPVYQSLEETGQRLLETIQRNKGGANKDLSKFEKELLSLIQKWDR